ncbi:MAG TPA: sulfotransferase [Caulobacteraceae bacterium]|jgi:hypothetical protein|nr:sulfotransferase [Caulobacteraceae bacterium]
MSRERYQSTGRPKPPPTDAVAAYEPWRRVAMLLAIVTVAVLYWIWPSDLIPDQLPAGRADDIGVALLGAYMAVRVLAGRRARPAPADRRSTTSSPARAEGVRQLERLAQALARHGPPVIIYNASHSGSRLLTRMLTAMGLYMGANLNDSEDSLDMAELVEHIVLRHAPNYASLFADGDAALETLAIGSATEHLRGRPAGARWGWKLCETGHALPVIARLFPDAQVIHLIRDGRDVAFSPFVAPKHAYWRKIYFGAGDLRSWRGLPMTQRAYRKHGPMFNAARWANSVTLGRAHGAMLGERYCEVRYEDLVADPAAAGARIAAFLSLPPPELPVGQLAVNPGRVGKWRSLPDGETVEVLQLLAPTLAAFGYDETGARP